MDRLPRALVNGIGDEVLMFSTTVIVIAISIFLLFVALCTRYFRRGPTDQDDGTQDEPIPPRGFNRDICPICIERHSFPVETNCGHLFCGTCLHEVYRHQDGFSMACPLCRNKITLLFVCFPTLEDERAELMARQEEIFVFVNFYNRGCAGFPLSIWQMIQDWPTTMRHFWYDFSIMGIIRFLTRARLFFYIAATVLYILSPLDVFPEALVGIIGYIDDFVIFAILAIHVSIVYRRLIIREGAAHNRRRF